MSGSWSAVDLKGVVMVGLGGVGWGGVGWGGGGGDNKPEYHVINILQNLS